ncbi:aconitase X catalytic domain-containing protein [Pararhizobium sp. YC-54]|uniref:aconitase X catalytic domain-containing protein n=1 Tax=Pararhizobium sp. YC-54 TaxID=2986920 RepID=UPI0021F77CB9|nr:aconitase X catalytic domain-containing protein [Pararhizobium sp. YC-54]MCW0001895.1 aconitase X catalytic domain-containing protein [Pararhizobium sp. YC-54]
MVQLSRHDDRLLSGAEGKAKELAIKMMIRTAEISGADSLIDVAMAHVNSCFYSGQVGLDFAKFLLAEGGQVACPTLTNVGLIDLLHPELRPEQANPVEVQGARELMAIYEKLGCKVVWTCAPYQLDERPGLGDQIVVAESNAVSFYNSVLGARTNKYGDFLDICAAVSGRVPLAGLHKFEKRRGEILFRLEGVSQELLQEDMFYHVLGIILGRESGVSIPVVDGLPSDTTEDRLKALSAAAAASGSVMLYHAVGVTPEARTLEDAFQGHKPTRIVEITPEMLVSAREILTTGSANSGDALGGVCLGTPHFSLTEFEKLIPMIRGRKVHPQIKFYIATSRFILQKIEDKGWKQIVEDAGITLVLDTCTYFTPVVNKLNGRIMTNSGKWAYYAPGMLKLQVAFGSMAECVESAIRGKIWRDPRLWSSAFWGRS